MDPAELALAAAGGAIGGTGESEKEAGEEIEGGLGDLLEERK
jgi:hypothetical protein